MNEQESEFIRGFNNGYLLEKFEPTLLTTVLKGVSPTSNYVDGMVAGKEEFELERSQRDLDDLHRLRNGSLNRDINLERD